MRILRTHEVLDRLGISRSTLYVWIAEGRFPASVSIGPRLVGWRESDVNEWIAARRPRSVQGEYVAARPAA